MCNILCSSRRQSISRPTAVIVLMIELHAFANAGRQLILHVEMGGVCMMAVKSITRLKILTIFLSMHIVQNL